MSFPGYARYKDSGVEWLGEVPEHWNVRRLGFYFAERREKVSDRDFPPLSVTRSGIVPQLETAAKTDDGDNRKKVCCGDFVINSRSDRKGSSGISKFDGSVSLISTVIQPQEELDPMFVHHLLRSQPFQEEYYRFGKGIVADLWSTSYSEMRNIVLAVPPSSEQQEIGSFVEREATKIEALIYEQQRLIELLKEKRQAVISHAVTRGLNPHAPMKPSGVEWLGDVPAHWQVVPLMHLTPDDRQIMYGIVLPGPDVDDGVPIVKGGDVSPSRLNLQSLKRTTREIEAKYARSRLRGGDIVYAIRGSIGAAEIVPEEITGANLTQDAARIATLPDVHVLWLLYTLKSRGVFGQLDQKATGATIRGINIYELKRARIPTPPRDEQRAIATFLAQRSSDFDSLIGEAKRAITLLQERRTALISAAVTGKIDLRGLDRAA
jgi:type I restriction enzyme S subunit